MGDILSNAGFNDWFTCPECLTDRHGEEGDHTCSNCGTRLRCQVDYQPVARCEVIDPDDDDEAARD